MEHIIFILTHFFQMKSNRNHAILRKFEWGPKRPKLYQVLYWPNFASGMFFFPGFVMLNIRIHDVKYITSLFSEYIISQCNKQNLKNSTCIFSSFN